MRIFMKRLTNTMIKKNIQIGRNHEEAEFHWINIAFENVAWLYKQGRDFDETRTGLPQPMKLYSS